MRVSQTLRFPSLDGIRCYLAIMVILAHELYTGDKISLFSWGKPFSFIGMYALQTFFVLSAFLITSGLLQEKEETESLNLPYFYLRRAAKLWPTLLVYLGVTIILRYPSPIETSLYLRAATMTIAWFPHPFHNWQLSHLWSMTIEEFYYLSIPILMLKLEIKVIKKLLFFLIFAAVVARTYNHFYFKGTLPYSIGQIHVLPFLDFFAVGSLLGIYYHQCPDLIRNWILRNPLGTQWLGAALMLVPKFLSQYGKAAAFTVSIGPTVSGVGIALTAIAAILLTGSTLYKIFNFKWAMYFGVRTYPIYLFQQLYFDPTKFAMADGTTRTAWLISFSIRLTLTLVTAIIVFACVEVPFQRYVRRKYREFRMPQVPLPTSVL